MLARRHITQEVSPAGGRYRSSDCGCNMVIPGGDVWDRGPQDIKWRAAAEFFLQYHVCLYLVYRHMPRPLYHYPDPVLICYPGQLAERCKFFNLGPVRCILEAAGPEAGTEALNHIFF